MVYAEGKHISDQDLLRLVVQEVSLDENKMQGEVKEG